MRAISRPRPWVGALVTTVSMILAAACDGDGASVSNEGPGSTMAASPPTEAATTSTTTDDPASASALRWRPCDEAGFEMGDCASLAVPLDYRQPSGPTIDVALFRVRATKPRVGNLLINPGGPGGSGVEFARDRADMFPDDFDIIGFDPRGIGRSHPIDCITDAERDAGWQHRVPIADPAEQLRWLDEAAEQAARCAATDLAPTVGTTNVARDLDRIRVALGDDQINYVGFSYGAGIAWTYAELFPTRVRAMVLDAPGDPTADTRTIQIQQTRGIAGQLEAFTDYCAAVRSVTCPSDPLAAIADVWHRAAIDPLPTDPSPHPPLSAQIAYVGVLDALFTDDWWPDLARALNDALDGDGLGLFDLAAFGMDRLPDDTYRDPSDAKEIIWCADHPDRPSVRDAELVTAEVATFAPLLAEQNPGPIPW